jgi:hypothetical protein
MDTWEDIRAGLDALLRLLAVGLLGLAGYAIKALLPLAKAALTEWLTTRAFARWTKVAAGAAAEIADPGNLATSIPAKAAEMVRGLPDAMAVLGGSQAAAERAISRALSEIKLAPSVEVVPVPTNVVGLKP